MTSDIIVIERKLLESKIYRSLSSTAKDVYCDFLMKRTIEKTKARPGRKSERIITNNGELEYTYSAAEKKGIPRSTFMNCLDQLVTKGFIDVYHSGSGGKKGDKSLYGFSDRWKSWGKPNFIEAERPKDARGGRGFSVYWKKKSANMGMVNCNPTITKNCN